MDNLHAQGLYYNFPKIKYKNLGNFNRLAEKNLVLNDTQFVVFTGCNSIDFTDISSNKDVKYFIKNISKHLNIYLYECLSFYNPNKPQTYGYFEEFTGYEDIKKINSYELDSLATLQKELDCILNVFTGDYRVRKLFSFQYPKLKLFTYDIFLRDMATPHGYDNTHTIEKKFWCGNGRYAPHRHLIMTHLAKKDGLYSWYYNCNIDWSEIFWLEDNICVDTLQENNRYLNTRTFVIDTLQKKINITKFNDHKWLMFNHSQPRKFRDSFCKTFVAIINESRFAQPTGNFSEKTFFAIDTLSPFILVAPPRTLEYLQKLGFKTFSNWWDESYDKEYNHSKRLEKIFNLIDYIDSFSYDKLKKIYNEMKETLHYNLSHFENFKNNKIILRK